MILNIMKFSYNVVIQCFFPVFFAFPLDFCNSYPPFLDQPPFFSKISPCLEIQDVPTIHRFIGNAK